MRRKIFSFLLKWDALIPLIKKVSREPTAGFDDGFTGCRPIAIGRSYSFLGWLPTVDPYWPGTRYPYQVSIPGITGYLVWIQFQYVSDPRSSTLDRGGGVRILSLPEHFGYVWLVKMRGLSVVFSYVLHMRLTLRYPLPIQIINLYLYRNHNL